MLNFIYFSLYMRHSLLLKDNWWTEVGPLASVPSCLTNYYRFHYQKSFYYLETADAAAVSTWGLRRPADGLLYRGPCGLVANLIKTTARISGSDGTGTYIIISIYNTKYIIVFLHTFQSPAFNLNIEVAINESCCFTLTSAILKFNVVCDVTMT